MQSHFYFQYSKFETILGILMHPRGTNIPWKESKDVKMEQMSQGFNCLRGMNIPGEQMSGGTNVLGELMPLGDHKYHRTNIMQNKGPREQMYWGTNIQGDKNS